MTPIKETKEIIDELDPIEIKMSNLKCCIFKGTINRLKRQTAEWEKMFANRISDKGLPSRIYKELIQVNNNQFFFQ